MPRKEKERLIRGQPLVSVFKPAGVPARELKRVTIRLDEYEAIRLADYEGLRQEDVARHLGVSRPTVSRILASARRKIAMSITKGMARSYWSNNGFSANVLNDVPNESKLEPAEWGEAEVE